TRLKCLAANSLTLRPPSSPPVNATTFTNGWVTIASPQSLPKPVTTLNTPGGNPALTKSSASSRSDTGVCSEGFATIVLPAASAGASFHAVSNSEEFQGVMVPTTPTGSYRV